MTKHLVLFSDGTGNSAGKLFKTNVWRLYQAIDLADPAAPPQPRQFAFYDDGVGTSTFKPWAMLGGAFGFGLARNVVDLYVFLCRMYEPGDKIYAFGFSRGAFTIRVLLGLVMHQGLLRYRGSESDLRRLGKDAYRAYRAERFKSLNPLVGLLRGGRDLLLRGLNRLLGRPSYAQAERLGRPDAPDAVTVQFVGLWDTVDAYGLPVDELTRAIDRWVWPLTMRDYTLNPRVLHARHALALDDERNAFHPRLWNEDPALDRSTDIRQVWFAGVHANVGGGYPDDGLSYVSLQWIMAEAVQHGLRFEADVVAMQAALSDENGPIYDSRRGLAGYYRYNPRRIERLAANQKIELPQVLVHESVLRRIAAGHDGYAPISLPPGFDVVTIDGRVVPGAAHQALAIATSAPVSYAQAREAVFNWVWARRIVYFLTLALTLALLLMPLFLPGSEACAGRLCFLTQPIAALGWLLPSFATVWTRSFTSHPDLALPLLGLVLLAIGLGSALEVRVRDRMRRVWYAVAGLKPPSTRTMPPPRRMGCAARMLARVRNHRLYQGAFKLLTHGLLPLLFLMGLAGGVAALVLRVEFAWRASAGQVCRDPVPGAPGPQAGGDWFSPSAVCHPTSTVARAGATYRIRFSMPAGHRFHDASLPAGPQGFECPLPAPQALMMAAGVALRRHPTEPWFQPMARIGDTGNDSYVLTGAPRTAPLADRCPVAAAPGPGPRAAPAPASAPAPAPAGGCGPALAALPVVEVFQTEIVARSSGRLFVYVNDALVWQRGQLPFYANNTGCARVEVLELKP